jgi:hypothetical protein
LKERKKKEIQTHLTESQYYKWQFYITEWQKAVVEAKLVATEVAFAQLRLKTEGQVKLDNAKSTEQLAEIQYHNLKKDLERETNRSLNETAIDPFTFEIRKLD